MNKQQCAKILRLGLKHGMAFAKDAAAVTPATWDDLAAAIAAQAVNDLWPFYGARDDQPQLPVEVQHAGLALARDMRDGLPAEMLGTED